MKKIFMKKILVPALLAVFFSVILLPQAATAWNPFSKKDKGDIEIIEEEETAEVLANFRDNYPGLEKFFDKAYGYAVFPSVGKGGILLGGSRGKGDVYEEDVFVGKSTLTQLTVGLQIGGQVFREIIFFKRKRVMADFKEGRLTLGDKASAVALKEEGVPVNAQYKKGVAIFTLAKSGLMFETSVGGQRFTFVPLEK